MKKRRKWPKSFVIDDYPKKEINKAQPKVASRKRNPSPDVLHVSMKKTFSPFEHYQSQGLLHSVISKKILKSPNLLPLQLLDPGNRFVVFDLETTGFDVHFDKIVEIGGVEIKNSRLTGFQFQCLVQSNVDVHPIAKKVNGLDLSVVNRNGFEPSYALKMFKKFCEKDPKSTVLLSHNKNFDMKFLRKAWEQAGLGFFTFPECYCSLELFRMMFEKENMYDLDSCKFFGIKNDERMTGNHGSLLDSIQTELMKEIQAGNFENRGRENETFGLRRKRKLESTSSTPKEPLRKKRKVKFIPIEEL